MENLKFSEISDVHQGALQICNKTLTYTGRNVTHIPEVLWKLHGSKIEHLDLSYNKVNNIYGLEGFKNLKELILDNNEINDTVVFPFMPELTTLSLNNNKINELALFIQKVKLSFPNLKFLSLHGNKACPNQLSDPDKDENDYQRYRYFVLHHLKKLKFLDSASVSANEMKEAAVKGQFMQIRKPKEPTRYELERFSEEDWNFTPLPTTTRSVGDHRGAYTTYRFRHTNKESEGNRFILNNDL
ncbi:hypothetical protein PGB90_006568 [Kerria lacca]